MVANPVLANELRKSLIRRKPVLFVGLWAGGVVSVALIAAEAPPADPATFLHILLPIVVPGFAAGAFAKEREQHTWTDLMLTRLTTAQILSGKFLAAYLPALAVLATLLPAAALMYVRGAASVQSYTYYTPYSSSLAMYPSGYHADPALDGLSLAVSLGMKGIVQAAFYVSAALVCSHYCRKARVALAVCFVALGLYAILGFALVSSVDVRDPLEVLALHQSPSPLAMDFGARLHLITCLILTLGAWLLLSVGLRFEPE